MTFDFLFHQPPVFYVLMGCLILGGLILGVLRVGRWVGESERQEADVLSAIMAATVLRRSLEESMGLVLEGAVDQLKAASGSLHLAEGEGRFLRMVYAVGIEQFDLLARIPLNDSLVSRLLSAPEDAIVEPLNLDSPWTALSPGTGMTLIAVRLGGRNRRQGLMVLAWRSRRQAEKSLQAVLGIGRYTRQMLFEFDELARRAGDFQALSETVQRLEALTRTAAHDLGNKMSLAYGFLSVLAEETLAPDHQAIVSRVLRHLEVLKTMLEDFKDPDRPLELERVPVEEIVELSAGLMARQMEDVFFEFTVDVPAGLPDLWGERIAILRILDNLLSNAVKHNLDTPNLHIWLCARQVENQVMFEIGDSGAGIPLEAQSKLFEFGFRVESSGQVKGHGMGLWSCRRLVEAHGGRIWVESQPGQGTRFFFTLPVSVMSSEPESKDRFVMPQPVLTSDSAQRPRGVELRT
jgi:signal transduction histidine kinase